MGVRHRQHLENGRSQSVTDLGNLVLEIASGPPVGRPQRGSWKLFFAPTTPCPPSNPQTTVRSVRRQEKAWIQTLAWAAGIIQTRLTLHPVLPHWSLRGGASVGRRLNALSCLTRPQCSDPRTHHSTRISSKGPVFEARATRRGALPLPCARPHIGLICPGKASEDSGPFSAL